MSNGALVIYRNGKVVGEVSVGDYSPESAVPVASLSKAITAVCVIKVVEQGKLSLADRLGDVLTKNGYHFQPKDKRAYSITVAQLLTQTSGIGNDPTQSAFGQFFPYYLDSKQRQLDVALTFPMEAKPGAKWSYNNVNYQALGLLIEAVEGEKYQQYCKREVLEPLGIVSAHINGDWRLMGSAGGWNISISDYARFLDYFDSSKKLTKKSLLDGPAAPIGRRKVRYGPGVFQWNEGGFVNFDHAGRWWGTGDPQSSFGAYVFVYHGDVRVVAAFTPAADDAALEDLVKGVRRYLP
jgi:CubicO group peptidase (beta-lactamase class C family)